MHKAPLLVCAMLLIGCSSPADNADGFLLSAISAGSGFTCGLQPDSTAVCWGANQYGQLGAASSERCKLDPVASGQCSARPVAVSGSRKFAAIDAGESHVCALAPDGQLFCWGDNASGQLGSADSSDMCSVEYYAQRGYGPTPCARAPRAVTTALRFASISAASGFTCALTREGQAYCWGKWTNGRFDPAAASIPPGPVLQNDATEPFTQISADGGRACAVTSLGRILCWGARNALTPVAIATDVQFTSVSRGWRHTCASARDQSTMCWGENDSGQLGNGVSNPHFNSGDTTMHRVAGNIRFQQVDAGFLSTCGVTADGVLYCWGDGLVVGARASDRCAHGNTAAACALKPVRTELNDVVAMTSGFTHRCALRHDGRAFCWGNNESHAVSADSSSTSRTPAMLVR